MKNDEENRKSQIKLHHVKKCRWMYIKNRLPVNCYFVDSMQNQSLEEKLKWNAKEASFPS